MVTVEQFCDVCMKNLKMIVVGNNPDEDFIWCKRPECDGIASYSRIKGKDARRWSPLAHMLLFYLSVFDYHKTIGPSL